MRRFTPNELQSLVAELATKAGVQTGDAAIFARALVDADVHGTSTHGLSRLGIYLTRIEKGLIDPSAELTVDRSRGAVMSLDARNGLGQVQAAKALELLMPLAREHGVAAATIRNSQHFGALSYYTNYAAEQGFILLAMPPIKIDLATSIVARGNIIAANRKQQPIPEGWALDPGGNPTTDAAEALKGTVLTMAGHKGYALALMVEMFSSVLSGSAIGSSIGSMYKDLDRPQDVGHFFCLFDVTAFLDKSTYDARVGELTDKLKANKRRPGVEEILLPGERSARVAAENESAGLTLAPETAAELEKWCEKLHVAFPAERAGV
jgi:LDH2 family malate/lactate/ureidoglycolate dehydrogenase